MSFNRRAELTVGDAKIFGGEFGQLRMAFQVSRDKSRDPNDATIQVWNLSPSRRAAFEGAERIACELKAGYEDESIHRIFSGVLLDATSEREGPDWVTTFSLGDDGPEKAVTQRIQRKFAAGTEVSTVLRELVRATGLKPGNLSAAVKEARFGGATTLTRPWTAGGAALGELHAFARSVGLQYTIQEGEVRFLGFEPPNNGRGPIITGENVQPPSIDAEGNVKFVCRMLPDLVPGVPVRLDTQKVSGDFVALKTQHVGDTYGSDWAVDVLCAPISAIISQRVKINA